MKKNIFYLFLVQTSNYIIPLLTLPYLLRTLGIEGFGKLMLGQAIIQYFILITDFGFNFSATKKIAQADKQQEINVVYTNTISAKIVLLCLSFIAYLISFFILELFEGIELLTAVLFFMVIGNVFYPVFLFQGLEKMKNIAWASIVSKVLMFIFLILFVRHENDLLTAAVVFAAGGVLPGIFSLYIIRKEGYASFDKFSFSGGIGELKDSWPLFISQISISFYSTFNVILLGYLFNPAIAGYYAAADKLRNAVQGVFQPIQQVIFPRLNKEKDKYKSNFINFSVIFILFSLLVSLLVFYLGQPISIMYFGASYIASSLLFKWMSILIFIVSIAIVFAQWGLISIGYEKILTKIYLLGAILHLVYSPFVVRLYGLYSMLGCVILTELFLTIIIIVFYLREWKRL
ncbi:TPA: flippase [Escherichia albertii]